jgi:transcriptional regulator with XRE-family HTH domain
MSLRIPCYIPVQLTLECDRTMKTIGERIRILRIARGLSQQDLADRLGITKGAVMHWETGRTKNIRNETMLALVRILKTDQEFLLYGPTRIPTPDGRKPRPDGSGRAKGPATRRRK